MRQKIFAWAKAVRKHRRLATLLLYGLIAVAGYTCAFLLRFGFHIPHEYASIQGISALVLVALRVSTFAALRLDRTMWRFAGTSDILRLGSATVIGSLFFLLLSEAHFFGIPIPHLIIMLEMGITANLTAAGWLYYRVAYEFGRTHGDLPQQKRALIIGAGEAGYQLAREIQRSPLGYRLLGFIDDRPENRNMEVCGTKVLGTTADLDRVVFDTRADELLISPNWYDQKSFRGMIAACQRTGLPMKLLPAFSDMVRGNGLLERLRAVRVEDLLGREPVELALPELALELGHRSVLITGAAGSIGSELARQIALHRPATLVLFDHDETQLFFIEMELRELYADVQIVPVVGDITDERGVEAVFRRYHPEWVFHAAAYKHVPMMETNAREAIRNNLIATRSVAAMSGEHGAQKFVLMSTDKAVRPCSVMGASKRLAELAVLELQHVYPRTAYCGVRFGNVMGSRGSVLPIFQRQADAGRPLTVTHPDVTRYFMTIPEAVQLILQASLLPDIAGRLAMLEMGDPVHILEMAQNFLRLSGRADSHGIVFTGLRRGERLHEELVAPDEETLETRIAKVRIIITQRGAKGEIERLVRQWTRQLDAGDDAEVLKHLCHRFPALYLNSDVSASSSVDGLRIRKHGRLEPTLHILSGRRGA